MRLLIVLLSALLGGALVQASDTAKEQRWADQIVDALLDGEAVWLEDDGHEFLSIFTEAEEASDRAMIVVHGTGVHPDWDQVVKPVRVQMTGRGWSTLSIQMPILANEAGYEEYVPLYPEVPGRFRAAEAFLQDKGYTDIVIVAHSQGASMSAYYLANNASTARAFVAIGMGATQADEHINSANALAKIKLPVLDLYGSNDLDSVLDTVEKRAAAAAENKAYRQQRVDGAEHFFDGKNSELIEAIDQWLENS
ncbi:MAG: DUF3530 family protein [Gammaproteobacteria bacterium]|nr:DUF3530 family protein [Gammaproteobacteria bacterium]